MNKLAFLITWRYLLGARSEKNISIMVLICLGGIFIGTFTLILVASIMNGFEKATHQKLQGVHAQIIMRSNFQQLDAQKIEPILLKEFPEIQSFSPTAFKQVIMQKPDSDQLSNAVLVKIIDPAAEEKTSIIAHKIISSNGQNKTLQALLGDNQIIIGNKLAHALDVKPGETVNLLFIPEEVKGPKITLDQRSAAISALFSTGIDEFDSGLILVSFDFAKKLFPESGITQFNVQLTPKADEASTIAKLKQRFNLDVFSWKELYPALVSALKLEKYAMFFIIALIALVASMNIISLIFMQIIQKRADIAIYQAMGMHTRSIRALFMLMGISIGFVAGIAGLICALVAGWALQTYPFISLPDSYYVSHLPIQMEWYIFALVFLLIMVMSFIATWIPCRNINSINAANVLRFEG